MLNPNLNRLIRHHGAGYGYAKGSGFALGYAVNGGVIVWR